MVLFFCGSCDGKSKFEILRSRDAIGSTAWQLFPVQVLLGKIAAIEIVRRLIPISTYPGPSGWELGLNWNSHGSFLMLAVRGRWRERGFKIPYGLLICYGVYAEDRERNSLGIRTVAKPIGTIIVADLPWAAFMMKSVIS